MKRTLTTLLAALLLVAMVLPMASCGTKVQKFEGDYTYKDSVVTMSSNWNPHTYQTTDESYPIEFLTAGLYTFVFNDELNPVEGKDAYAGYKIIPEMAASEPVDVTEQIKKDHPEFGIPESATKGYAYTIDLNQKATWQDGTKINADTYVYSMKQLLDPKLQNYRATDYYANNFCIAGAEEYNYGGRTVNVANSSDGETMTYAIADLVKGEDGQYKTVEGYLCYFGLKTAYAWMGGESTLDDYHGAGYIPDDGCWSVLSPLADEDGFVPVTDDTIAALFSFTNSDIWGNEPKEQLGYYLSYKKSYEKKEYDGTVGLYKSGEYQITLVLGKSLTGFNLLYNLSGNWIVYQPYYDANIVQVGDTDAWESTYNTSVETTMSYGPYKLVSYQADKAMRFEKNENWYGYSDGKHIYVDPTDGKTYPMYQTTAIDCQVVAEAETRKLMFLKGELMTYGLQSDDFAEYRNSKYCYVTPDETIFFFIFNGYMDAIKNREANEDFDKTKYDLETITLTSFRQAVAVTYDKEALCDAVSPSRSGGYGLIGNSYIYDPDTGARYRDTDQAKQVLCDFYSVDVSKYASLDDAVASITGYDETAAKALYTKAFNEALEKGFITSADGTHCDQEIVIEYASSATSSFITKTLAYLNEKMTEVLVGTPFEGKISFKESAPLGNEWSNNIKNGLSDTVLGGWSGSALDPFSSTDCYTNPSYQYDAKWFDASSVKVEMEVNVAGIEAEKAEMKKLTMSLSDWSDCLNGTVVTVDGVEYNFGDGMADVDTRLNILAKIESTVLQTYDYIPMLQNAGMSLLSQQVYYVVEEYNPIMGRGGIAYLKYNYDDTAWTAYVASQTDGQLAY